MNQKTCSAVQQIRCVYMQAHTLTTNPAQGNKAFTKGEFYLAVLRVLSYARVSGFVNVKNDFTFVSL